MQGLTIRLREERGISVVIVAISLVGLLGAAVLAIDAGSAWATRRQIVTATDAAALAAARLYSQGLADPCTGAGITAGQNESTLVLNGNSAAAEPLDYQVTVSGCPSSPVGHVRVDSRLGSQQAFSGIFGFGQTKPFSSSTAEFGYVVELAGLRPIAVCDQSTTSFPSPLPNPPYPPGPGPQYPHFELWNRLQKQQITLSEYNSYYGSLASEYPTVAAQGINAGATYPNPNTNPTYGLVHRINAKDDCHGGSSWRGWVDLNSGSNKNNDSGLAQWLENGYDGDVSLSPKDCNNGTASQPDPNCAGYPGNRNANNIIAALDKITCPIATPSKDCFSFPVVLDNGVSANGNNTDVSQVGFLSVILRGYSIEDQNNPCKSNTGCLFDFEFLKVQLDGKIGSNPSGGTTTPRGTDLCGIDHDTQANRCNV
jgi:putative Flp pilus-assembly TadE/G-like protein